MEWFDSFGHIKSVCKMLDCNRLLSDRFMQKRLECIRLWCKNICLHDHRNIPLQLLLLLLIILLGIISRLRVVGMYNLFKWELYICVQKWQHIVLLWLQGLIIHLNPMPDWMPSWALDCAERSCSTDYCAYVSKQESEDLWGQEYLHGICAHSCRIINNEREIYNLL